MNFPSFAADLFDIPMRRMWMFQKFIPVCGLGFALLAALTPGSAPALEGSLAFQGGVAGAFNPPGVTLKDTSGPLGYGYLDFNLNPWLSLGAGSGLTALTHGTSRLYFDETDLIGRIAPWARAEWSSYVMGGVGFRPFYDITPDHRWWPGNFGTFAGVGLRHPIVPGLDLDASVYFDANGTTSNLLDSIGTRVGLALPFGDDSSSREQSARSSHKLNALQQIAMKAYGDPDLYPLLIDANFKDIHKPLVLPAGVQLVIPQGVTGRMTATAHMKARTSEYQEAAETFSYTPSGTYRVKAGDCLWDIARQKAVYGSGWAWEEIYNANKNSIKDPNLIVPNQELVIPSNTNKQ